MESLSSESKSIALDILEDILSAIEKLEERTKDVHSIDDFLSSPSGMVLLDASQQDVSYHINQIYAEGEQNKTKQRTNSQKFFDSSTRRQ